MAVRFAIAEQRRFLQQICAHHVDVAVRVYQTTPDSFVVLTRNKIFGYEILSAHGNTLIFRKSDSLLPGPDTTSSSSITL